MYFDLKWFKSSIYLKSSIILSSTLTMPYTIFNSYYFYILNIYEFNSDQTSISNRLFFFPSLYCEQIRQALKISCSKPS